MTYVILLIVVLFCGVLLAVLPHLFYLLVRVFSPAMPYAPWGWTALALVLIGWGILAYGFFIGRWKIDHTKHIYQSAMIPHDFDGYKIIHISDLHLSTFEDGKEHLERIVEQINSLNADLICFTGDLVTIGVEEAQPYVEILNKMKAKDGVVSILGNHDFFIYARQYPIGNVRDEAIEQLVRLEKEQLGWQVLRNSHLSIKRGKDSIAIIGVDNIHCAQEGQGFTTINRGDLAKAIQGVEEPMKILLSHDPTHWRGEVVPNTDIAITLSGHTHAAQIRLFGWTPASWWFDEVSGRYDNLQGQMLYVNAGLGCTAPFRIGVGAEITEIILKCENCN